MTSEIRIVSVDASVRRRAVDSVTRAFLDDPMWSCVLPERRDRQTLLRPMWNALIGFSRVYGEALTTPEGKGAVCWIAPGNTETTLWKLIRTGFGLPRSMMRLPKDARERFFGMMRFIDGHHKALMTVPHWYLWMLGVAPDAQRQGIGGFLLEPVLRTADKDAVPCYLETQTEGNVAFYRKRGFEIVREDREPVGGLPIWFMVRRPRPI